MNKNLMKTGKTPVLEIHQRQYYNRKIRAKIHGPDSLLQKEERTIMEKQKVYRAGFYVLGLLILAMGLTLNTKAGLGVSPIISVSYSISTIFHLNFGDMTLVLYSVFVVAEIFLHSIRERQRSSHQAEALVHARKNDRKLILLMDILQIPLSLVFTRFLNVFGSLLPEFSKGTKGIQDLPLRLLVLILAIIFTGVGASMSLSMRIVPNPGDGIVQAIADCIHKNVGFTKNCFDLFNITVTILLGLVLAGRLVGVGIGTVLAVIGVGRIIALFQHLAGEKIVALSGVEV